MMQNTRRLFISAVIMGLSLTGAVSAQSGADAPHKASSNININSNAGMKLPEEIPPAKEEHSFFDWFGSDDSDKPTAEKSPVKSVGNKPRKAIAPVSPPLEVVVDDAAVEEAIAESKKKPAPKQQRITGHDLELARLQTYLNSLTTIVSDFNQIAPDGSLTTGKFYLKRPGKMRWEYDPPTPILMVSSGNTLVYYDSELKQVSHIPMGSTLASFLAREQINLKDPDIKIDSLTRAAGVLRITISQHEKPEEGSVMLEFSDMPLQIRNMVVTDAQRQVTTISLNKAQFGKPLEKSLFVWVDPRKK